MLTGGGAAGKSTMALTIAAHLALGKDFLDFRIKAGSQRSIIYNHEDDVVEMSRRLWALCQWYALPYDDVKKHVALVSRREFNLKLTTGSGSALTMHKDNCVALAKAAADPDIGLIALDPLVAINTAGEDDNTAMAYVMEILHGIIEAADVAALVLRHTKKTDSRISQAGDSSVGRGASSIGYAARFDYTMWTPTKDECETFGIALDKRFDFVRLDDAKMNYSKQQGLAGWFKKESSKLPAGDEVGVLVPYDMATSTDAVLLGWASIIAAEMRGIGRASCNLNEAASMLKAGDALMAKLAAEILRTRVKTALGSPRDTPSGRIKFIRELIGGKLTDAIVLE